MTIVRVIAILSVAALLSAQSYSLDDLDEAFGRTSIVISTNEGPCYFFDTFLAATHAERQRGLMFVRDLPDFTGMLFIYRDTGNLSMWMKNTYIPLDILFIHTDGSIANIARDTVPLSLESIRSTDAVNFVLELNAGVTTKLGIDERSQIVFMELE